LARDAKLSLHLKVDFYDMAVTFTVTYYQDTVDEEFGENQ